MDAGEGAGKWLADFELVTKEALGETFTTSIAIAAWLDNFGASSKLFIGQMYSLVAFDPDRAVTSVASWQHAIKHVDAVLDSKTQVARITDA